MLKFSYYLEKKEVKKVSKDIALAISLLQQAEKRAERVLSYDLYKDAFIIFENLYECLREIVNALLALDGYKSYSHQASFVYLEKYGYGEWFLQALDNFCYKRNGSKYYGKTLSKEDAREIRRFWLEHKDKLIKLLKHKLKEVSG